MLERNALAVEKSLKDAWDTIKTWAQAVKTFVTRWFTENTIVPEWVPKPLRHPLFMYLAAAVIQSIAIFLTVMLVFIVPDFTFRGALILLGVIGVALTLGAGPGLMASFVGTTLLDIFLTSPAVSLSLRTGADVLNVGFYATVCLATNMAASHAQRARSRL
jgi:K+-sensing histidine kinase KdpD